MRVALFLPCYVDQLFPDVGMAAVEVLERLGVEVDFPAEQTCCGQPMWNAGCDEEARLLAARHARIFRSWDRVVCPSASCVATVRRAYGRLLPAEQSQRAAASTFELCEFVTEVLGVEAVDGRFAGRIALHPSCHGLRELRLGRSSERRVEEGRDPARLLLSSLRDVELVALDREDECCGFGGTFAVDEAAVSCAMGRDRVRDFERAGAEVVTATDVSCLAHLDGVRRRDGGRLRVLHVAEILALAMRPEEGA